MRNTITVKNLGTFKNKSEAATWFFYVADKNIPFYTWKDKIDLWVSKGLKGFSSGDTTVNMSVPVATPMMERRSDGGSYKARTNKVVDATDLDDCVSDIFDVCECGVCKPTAKVIKTTSTTESGLVGNKRKFEALVEEVTKDHNTSGLRVVPTNSRAGQNIWVLNPNGTIKEMISGKSYTLDSTHEHFEAVINILVHKNYSQESARMRFLNGLIKHDADLTKYSAFHAKGKAACYLGHHLAAMNAR